ncbi:MAG: F0F1 ATP synthase subunit A [candidate division Zixibacteria bacterium]|nr:F0F1 ATP synthase subunit A [candidate division Zixibacteria bacterium]
MIAAILTNIIGLIPAPIGQWIMIATATEGGAHAADPVALPSIAHFILKYLGPEYEWVEHWVNIIFALATSVLFAFIATRVHANRQMIPGPFQNSIEMLVEGMYNFVHTMLGKHTKAYIPLLGTLFFYILVNNLWGIIPLGHSPSTSINVTASLALIVFCVTHYTGIKKLGIKTYLHHLMGSPKGIMMWCLTPIFLIIHLVGEIAKPASLALRLFGNITGEDILVAAFVGLGITALSFAHSPIGLPFNVPFILLGLLLSTIQALVFTLLSTIYILMMLPHEEAH